MSKCSQIWTLKQMAFELSIIGSIAANSSYCKEAATIVICSVFIMLQVLCFIESRAFIIIYVRAFIIILGMKAIVFES